MAELAANSYIKASGPVVGGNQAMIESGTPFETVSVSSAATDEQTTAVNVTLLSTDVEKSLGLVSTVFAVETNDRFGVAVHFDDVVASGVNGQFTLILKETVSGVIISQQNISVETTNISLNEWLADIASGNEASASLELLATGITRDITFTNNVVDGRMIVFRSRSQDIQAVKV